jgi:type I restriction enzyme, S subunit
MDDLSRLSFERLPSGWRIQTLGQLVERRAVAVDPDPTEFYREIGIRSHGKGIFHKEPIRGRELGEKRVYLIEPGCLVFNIVFAWEGAVGLTSLREAGMIASHRFPTFLPRDSRSVDTEFLRRFFQTQLGVRLLGEASPGGAGRNRTLNQKFLEQIPIPVPPLSEQRKIAAILSSVDDAIEASQAVIEQLQVVKKAMMAELLTKGLPGRHKKFKQTEIGAVPEEWEVVRLGDVGDWLSGGTPSKQEPSLWKGPVPWVSPKDMKRPRINDAIDHVSQEALKRGTQLAPVGSVLMVVRGMILAHTFPVAVTVGPVAFNQDIKALVPASSFQSEFMLYWLQERESEILNLAEVSNHGTKRLPSELLFDSKVPKPPAEEQAGIVEILRSFDGRLESEQVWLVRLRETKSALMSVLLTGEVRVHVDEEVAA